MLKLSHSILFTVLFVMSNIYYLGCDKKKTEAESDCSDCVDAYLISAFAFSQSLVVV